VGARFSTDRSMVSAQDVLCAHASLRSLSFDKLRAQSGASEIMIEEYLKFIALKAAYADYFASLLSCPPEVDAIWHTHLLDTLSYHEMCEAVVPAGRFIHHNPNGGQDEAARAERRKRALTLYEKSYGKAPAYWKAACASRKRPASAAAGGDASRARYEGYTMQGGGMKLFVRTLHGTKLTLEVEPSESIAKVAEKIQDKEGIAIHVNNMHLVFEGRRLEGISRHPTMVADGMREKSVAELKQQLVAQGLDSRGKKEVLVERLTEATLDTERRENANFTLASYNIKNESTIYLIPRMKGC